jgi:hypothetical protein
VSDYKTETFDMHKIALLIICFNISATLVAQKLEVKKIAEGVFVHTLLQF